MKYNPAEDGITHINIYSKGKTELGRLLSNFADTPFETPQDGKFESVEGYWYWLLVHDLRLRKLHGFKAKQLGKQLRAGLSNIEESLLSSLPDFQIKIKTAFLMKLAHTKNLKELLMESTLPFTHYYVFNGKVKEAGHEWQVEWWEQTRKQLQGNLWT